MDDLYERRLFAECFLKIMRQTGHTSRLARDVAVWFSDNAHDLGIELPEPEDSDESSVEDQHPSAPGAPGMKVLIEGKKPTRQSWRLMRSLVEPVIRRGAKAKPSLLELNLRAFAREIGLAKIEHDILAVAIRYRAFSHWDSLIDVVSDRSGRDLLCCLSILTGYSTAQLGNVLRTGDRLQSAGLAVASPSPRSRFNDQLGIVRNLVAAVLPPQNGIADIHSALFGDVARPDLEWSDFDHLGQDRDILLRLLKGAVARREKGINILFYGPPGTGKTELCRVLAAQAGLALYGVGERDDDGNEPTAQERVAGVRLSQTLSQARPNTALLFDEMEDVLQTVHRLADGSRPVGSKVFFNRLLENNPVPTFWTVNRIGDFDPALLRRMTYAVELRIPTRGVRERVWRRLLERSGIAHSEEAPSILAREFPEAPALATNAVRAAIIAGGGMNEIRHAVRRIAAAMNGGSERAVANPETGPYALELLNADLDLVDLSKRLKSRAQRHFSLCLSGPSGTGKSAYVRHLAQELGIEVLQKRTSDLLSPFVGVTERRIADAFQEARSEAAFLVFDEADSLLYDRRNARHSWEISAVNEMLTWMERHDLPFACTTNLDDRLDPASLRRFTFKVTFDYLKADLFPAAFRLYFGLDVPYGTPSLQSLAPGDFAVARRKAEILGLLGNPDALIGLLRQEAEGRSAQKTIGFCLNEIAH